ncbi:hypothetical protein [Corynebacterium provencense]|uniref:hypothetical protein n=1 Tax=Corynebacterium provencense TaxID=1737425 RepID=UPI0011CCDF24|nr:hypothetical protein [Corynebacterium provencense]
METMLATSTILNLVLLLTFTITDRMKPSTSIEHALNIHRTAEEIKDSSLRAEATAFTRRNLKVELELSASMMNRARHLFPALFVILVGSFGATSFISLGYDEPPTNNIGFIVGALAFSLSALTIALLSTLPLVVDAYRSRKEKKRKKGDRDHRS